MKNAILILTAMLPLVVACSKRPEITQQKTTTTTSSSVTAPAPEVIEQKRSTTVTVQ